MKKRIVLALINIVLGTMIYGQNDFNWEKIDSVSKTKTQIYADTKLYIAQKWASAQDVIQLDDKESGVILVKGQSRKNMFFQLNDHEWIFTYTVSFYMRDFKYRILINNVNCISAKCQQYEWPHLLCSDTYPGYWETSLSQTRYSELMSTLKAELQSIFDGYAKHIQEKSITNSDW